MKLKVNIPMLAESEMELRVLSTRMRAIADEVYAVRSSLLSFGETFRHEASLTGRKQDKLMEEMLQMRTLADVLENVLELYGSCERQQEMNAEITNAAIPVSRSTATHIKRIHSPMNLLLCLKPGVIPHRVLWPRLSVVRFPVFAWYRLH